MTHSKRIIYGKIGRVLEMDPSKWGSYGGDNEAPQMLLDLARRHPTVEWINVSKNVGWTPPLPNITNIWCDQDLQTEVRVASRDAISQPWTIIPTFDRLIMPMFDDSIDGVLFWLGQHGVGNSRIPSLSPPHELLRVMMNFARYASYMFRGVNYWKRGDRFRDREEVWLMPDVRNYLKARDLKWPVREPILSQYKNTRSMKYYRYGDPRTPTECGYGSDVRATVPEIGGVWSTRCDYAYSGLELCGVGLLGSLDELPPWEDRERFGVIINENKINYNRFDRKVFLHDYILPMNPSWVHGGWSEATKEEMADEVAAAGIDLKPVEYDIARNKLMHVKATVTTPASGSVIATAKPWECFAAGVLCFFASDYDAQGHILPTQDQLNDRTWDPLRFNDDDITLARWLRVPSPETFKKRLDAVDSSHETWQWLVAAQYKLLIRRKDENQIMSTIDKRLGL